MVCRTNPDRNEVEHRDLLRIKNKRLVTGLAFFCKLPLVSFVIESRNISCRACFFLYIFMSIYKLGTKEYRDPEAIAKALARIPETKPSTIPGDNYEDPTCSIEAILKTSKMVSRESGSVLEK